MHMDLFTQKELMDCADTVLHSDGFSLPEDTLLMDVPFRCIQSSRQLFSGLRNPSTLPAEHFDKTFDFVLCRKEQVLLGVVLHYVQEEYRTLTDAYFPGLPVLSLSAFDFCSNWSRKWERLAAEMKRLRDAQIGYTQYCISCKALGYHMDEFVRRGLLCHPTALSDYGKDTGLFFRYSSGKGGTLCELCAARSFLPKVTDALNRQWYFDGEDVVLDKLKVLPGRPLKELCATELNAVSRWERLLQCCEETLAESHSVKLVTFADLLRQLDRIRRFSPDLQEPESPAVLALTQVVTEVAQGLYNSDGFLTSVPLPLYFALCGMIFDTNYPMWLYEHSFCPYINEAVCPRDACTVGTMMDYLLHMEDRAEKVRLLTDLLLALCGR